MRSDTERSAVQDVFAFATTLSKPKYNRLAPPFISSFPNWREYRPAPKRRGSRRCHYQHKPGRRRSCVKGKAADFSHRRR